MTKKVKAEDRTISFLSGKTTEEERAEAERIAANADIKETEKSTETIEQAADRWRASAFQGAEWTTKYFPNAKKGREYRLTRKGDWFYLEKIHGGDTAYSYAGVMFPADDVQKLKELFGSVE